MKEEEIKKEEEKIGTLRQIHRQIDREEDRQVDRSIVIQIHRQRDRERRFDKAKDRQPFSLTRSIAPPAEKEK